MGQNVPSSLAIQLLPEWTPSSVDPTLARLDAVVKVPRGAVLQDGPMEILLLNDGQSVRTAKIVPVSAPPAHPAGEPFWTIVRGGLVKMTEDATHACAVLAGVRSTPEARREAMVPLLLRAIASQIDVAGEPHLWWRFYNDTQAAISVDRIFGTMRLQIDDRTLSPPPAAYNGPAEIPSRRALSGWWSLDDFDPRARIGRHRFRLMILERASEPFVFEWKAPSG